VRWKTSRAGPATRIRPVITALGGVRAVMTNPVAWGVDPCLGICPFPHRYDSEPVEADGPPKSLWQARGPNAAFASGQKGTVESASPGVVTSTNDGAASVTSGSTSGSTSPTCPSGQVAVDLGNRIVCRIPWGN
jgi:hypothetical protein